MYPRLDALLAERELIIECCTAVEFLSIAGSP